MALHTPHESLMITPPVQPGPTDVLATAQNTAATQDWQGHWPVGGTWASTPSNRFDVLTFHAKVVNMLRDGTFYQPKSPRTA